MHISALKIDPNPRSLPPSDPAIGIGSGAIAWEQRGHAPADAAQRTASRCARGFVDNSRKRETAALSICGRPLSGKGKRWGRCCAWSDAVICPALMRQEDSRRPVWEFADWVQITRSVLEAQWKALVVPSVDAKRGKAQLCPQPHRHPHTQIYLWIWRKIRTPVNPIPPISGKIGLTCSTTSIIC